MSRPLEFCFDFISPYSYIALHALPRFVEGKDIDVVYKPVFLGAIMRGTDNRPPGFVPAKNAYMQTDIQRSCRRYGIGFRMHPSFPMMNTRPALRIACALAGSPSDQSDFIRAVFHGVWTAPEPLETDDLEQIGAACRAAGLDAERLVSLADGAEAKALLVQNTDQAIARGAFGAPSMFVGDELFFGHDRLDYAVEAAVSA